MKRILIRLALTTAVVVPLAACSGNNEDFNPTDNSPPLPPVVVAPPPPPAAFSVESFGSRFAAIFRTAADTEPSDPGEGDIIPIDFTTEAGEPIGFQTGLL